MNPLQATKSAHVRVQACKALVFQQFCLGRLFSSQLLRNLFCITIQLVCGFFVLLFPREAGFCHMHFSAHAVDGFTFSSQHCRQEEGDLVHIPSRSPVCAWLLPAERDDVHGLILSCFHSVWCRIKISDILYTAKSKARQFAVARFQMS